MRFTIDAKKLLGYLEDISLKGKYYNGSVAKNGVLSDHAVLSMNEVDESLMILNANQSVACRINHFFPPNHTRTSGMCVVDINSTVKHLKIFNGEITFDVGDYIKISQTGKKASLSKVLTHLSMDMISRISNYDMLQLTGECLSGEGSVDGVKFGKTAYEAKLCTLEDDMIDAATACDVLGVAKYKFEYDGDETLIISSKKSEVDTIEVTIELLEGSGEPSTVEFTGPFSKFLKGSATIYMKDECPILIASGNRMLIKAPYLER